MDCDTRRRMVDALERAAEVAQPGDTVLLSPACASFDEFSGFAERGEVFAAWVARHAGEAS
jgi:UDP-N-acetylmuramoylalanine--D-glutamate ligase